MKKGIKIIIVAIILLIALIGCIILVISNNNRSYEFSSLNNEKDVIMDATPVQYLFKAMNVYRGFSSRNTINKTYYNFAINIVPKYKNLQLTDDGAKKYFNRSKDNINKELGITNVDEFVDFIKLVNTINDEEFKLKEYRIYSQSINDIGDYLDVYIGIVYEGQKEIVFNSRIKTNPKENETAIVFNANVNNEKLEEWKFEEAKSIDINTSSKPLRGTPLNEVN